MKKVEQSNPQVNELMDYVIFLSQFLNLSKTVSQQRLIMNKKMWRHGTEAEGHTEMHVDVSESGY